MDAAAAVSPPKPAASDRLLRHCRSFDPDECRPPAQARLEALLGSELARRLVQALSSAR